MSAINCKFEKILLKKDSKEILEEFNQLIKILSLKMNKEDLKPNEYEQIFQFNKSDIKNIKCSVRNSQKHFGINFYYDFNNDRNRKTIYLIKEPYSFSFNGDDYICFEKLSLIDFLKKENEKKKFIIIPKDLNLSFNSYISFIEFDISKFEIIYDYKNREINPDKCEPQNIYIKKNQYNAEDINYYFPYYIELKENDFNNFQYYDNEFRVNFLVKIIQYIDIHSYIAVCGPYGCGKTVTLLKLIMSDETRRFLYINLWTISVNNLEKVKELLKYECIKLFKQNILQLNDKNVLSEEEKNMHEIIKLINDFKDNEKIFELILNIISLLKNIKNCFIIVIDQYSSKYDINNNNIWKIIHSIDNSNIKLLICSSMDNEDIKNFLSKSFYYNKDLSFLYYMYVGTLIRYDSEYIQNESLSLQKLMYEFGNLYLYYYLLKDNERKNNDLNEFLNNEKKSIQKEIEDYYFNKEKEYLDKSQMTKDIVDIIYFINEKKIFLYEDLTNLITKLPLKFLEIKRQEINIVELKYYATYTGNQNLLKKIESYSYNKIESIYLISKEKTRFFRTENIIPKAFKRKINYNDYKQSLKAYNKMYIYCLDYLFPYIQDILSNIIYNESMKLGKLIFSNLDGPSQDGILELFIIEYIKDKKNFFDYEIDIFESMQNIVENSYFIQNHSSRKFETKRNYEEDDNIKSNSKIIQNKIKLPKKNILISQKQFTGKYYDCAFLFPLNEDETDNRFKIATCQISKKKIASQRYYKEEHELILGNVKKNVENIFDVEISEGYFFYIFSSQKLDQYSIDFCKNYDFEYVLFSPDKMNFDYSNSFNLTHSFITSTFPIQNSFSILPPEIFATDHKNKLINYDEIKSIQKKLINIKLSEKNKKILNTLFCNNEYIVLGYFEKKFNVSKYCLWYDKSNKEIYYKNSLIEFNITKDLTFDNNEKNDNFVLIGLKNEIFTAGNHLIFEYFKIN